jgi:cytochrome c553
MEITFFFRRGDVQKRALARLPSWRRLAFTSVCASGANRRLNHESKIQVCIGCHGRRDAKGQYRFPQKVSGPIDHQVGDATQKLPGLEAGKSVDFHLP